MSNENDRALTAREVLEAVFKELERRLSGKVVELAEPVEVTVEGISSTVDERLAPCLRYQSVLVVRNGRKKWAVALGSATGNSNNLYTCDIIALPLPGRGRLEERLFELIGSRKNELVFFQNSVSRSLCDGTLRFSGGDLDSKPNPLGQKMAELTDGLVKTHLHPEIVNNDGKLGPTLYKPSIVPALVDAIAQTLREVKPSQPR